MNTLDQIVKNHTAKAQTINITLPKELSPLEMASDSGRKVELAKKTTAQDKLFPRFDPIAMARGYNDKTLGFELPSLWAFDLNSNSSYREVTCSNSSFSINKSYSNAEYDLNNYSGAIWTNIVNNLSITPSANNAAKMFLIGLCLAFVSALVLAFNGNNYFFIATTGLGALLMFLGLSGLFMSDIKGEKEYAFNVQFDGLIPDKVRENINKNKHYFDSMLLVCDVQNSWSLEKRRKINADPLVIGAVKNGDDYSYYLVDQFDLTKVENLVAAEWSTNE